ncbi:MAG: hypothetical protein ABJF04_06900 [Reichenbachiella sp.]|uniref:hypothetical protein n=1 Tax=Reichenbachiella sp. TaxID=2184521 RepID=UPI0032641FC1
MEDKLSHTESLKIINEMIAQAKNNFDKSGSFYFLLWGWVVMVANLGHYLLVRFTSYEYPFAVWLLTIPAALVAAWYGVRQKNKASVKTHFSGLYGDIWIGVGICIVLSLVFMPKINFNHGAIIMMLAGIGTFMSGRMLKFQPLVVGAIALWIASVVCFNLPETDQYLVGAIGILAGYIIPGYLLKSAEQ